MYLKPLCNVGDAIKPTLHCFSRQISPDVSSRLAYSYCRRPEARGRSELRGLGFLVLMMMMRF